MLAEVHDEESAVLFLQNHNILPKTKLCGNGHPMKISYNRWPVWRCRRKTCNYEWPVRKGTWLEPCKLHFQTVLEFISKWSREMTTVKFATSEFNISKNTVVELNSALREVCVWRTTQVNYSIGGPGTNVELDKSLFASKNNKYGKLLPPVWLFGGICYETKQCFVVRLDDRTANTLIPVIMDRVMPGSNVISYCDLGSHGFKHLTDEHSLTFSNTKTVAHTRQVDTMLKSLKWADKKRRGTSRKFLDSYLGEYMWRAQITKEPFSAIIEEIADYWRHVTVCNEHLKSIL